MSSIRHERVPVGGVHLRCAIAGLGRPMVLLHGFPDFWYSWRHQIPVLADAGFRVVAPDLRGYGGSDRPRGNRPFALPELVGDIEGLIRRLHGGPVVLVGHDWGGLIGWALAGLRTDLVRRLVVLNAPHPHGYRRALRSSAQLLRSWYAMFFQIPVLPERLIRAFDLALLERALRRSVHREEVLTSTDIRVYKEALAPPGALEAAIAYYRMAARPGTSAWARRVTARVEVPTLVLWGERDPFLVVENLDGLERWVPDLTVERVPEAGHWVHWDAHERVSERLMAFGGA